MISDELVDAALLAAAREGFNLPYAASIRDHSDLVDLRAADRAAWVQNRDAMRAVLRSVLRAAAGRA